MIITISCVLLAVGLVLAEYLRMLQKRNTDLILQENLIREHYATLTYQMEQTRRIRHDIANHIYTIEQLSMENQNQEEALEDYKNELAKTYQTLQNNMRCDELIVDSAIQNKLRECRKKKIQVECSEESFSIGDIERIDMLGLLYNVFDNAIEACEKLEADKRRIWISMSNEGDTFVLHSRNAKNPQVKLKEGQKTSKKDKENHGIGRDIIKNIVRKYDGTVQVEEMAEEYDLHITCKCKCG